MTIINQITSFKISGFSYTGTDTQLNYTAGVTAGVAQPSKALILNSSSNITSGINSLTMNSLVTTNLTVNGTIFSSSTIANLASLDGAIEGSAVANKVLIVDSSRNIININSLSSTTLNGTLGTATQPNITSLGTLTGLISSGAVSITNATASTNTTTGALIVTGGTGIGGALNVGGALAVTGNITGTLATISQPNITTLGGVTSIGASGATTLTGTIQTASQPNITSIGILTSLTSSGIVSITNSTVSSSISTGALVVTGGVGIGGSLNVGGILNTGNALSTSLSNNTSTFINYADFINTGVTPNITTSLQMSNTGSSLGTTSNHFMRFITNNLERIRITSTGRLGIGTTIPDRIVEINANDGNCLRLTYNDNDGSATTYLDQSISIAGVTTFNSVGTAPGFILSGGSVSITNNTESTSTTTGSLIVTGGTGIQGNTYIGNILAIGQTAQTASSWTTSGIQLRTGSTTYTTTSTGTLVSSVFNSFARPTLAASTTGVVTTNAATLYIENAPLAGTNMTITNAYALWAASGRILFNDSTVSTSTSTGALVVTGGVGIGGAINAGSHITTAGTLMINKTSSPNAVADFIGSGSYVDGTYNRMIRCSGTNASPVQFEIQCSANSNITSTNAVFMGTITGNDLRLGSNNSTRLIITSSGDIGIGTTTPGTRLDILGSLRASGITSLTSGTASTNTTTGSLVVTGGVGISGALNLAGAISTTNNTASTSPTTGALIVTGGMGLGGSLYSSGRVWLTNTEYGFSHKYTTGGNAEIITYTDGLESNYIGTFTNNYFGLATSNTLRLDITPEGDVHIYNSTISSSTTTGALVVNGGVGIAGALNVGGNITGTLQTASQTNITAVGNLTSLAITPTTRSIGGLTSTNCLWTSTSDRFYGMRQIDTNNFVMLAFAAGGSYNDYITWTHNGTPNLTIAGSIGITNSTSSTSTTTGSLIVAGGVGIQGNTNIGNILAIGQTAQTASSWTTSGIQLRTGSTTYTTSSTGTLTSSVFNSFARPTLAATTSGVTTTNAATLYIANSPLAGTNMTITNSYALWAAAGRVLFEDSTASSSTTTGALVITGGVGIGGAVNTANTLTTSVSGNGFIHSNAGVSLITNVIGANSIGLLGISSNHPLGLITNGTERMRISASGDIGIGTNNPSFRLDVSGTGRVTSNFTIGGTLSTGNVTLNGTLITSTATELNYLSGITLGTITASKAVTVDASSNLNSILRLTKSVNSQQISFTNGTSSGTIFHNNNGTLFFGTISSNDLIFQTNNMGRVSITSDGFFNILSGLQISGTTVTATAAELNYLDITTIGTAEASKALVVDANRDITNIRNANFNSLTMNTSGTGRPLVMVNPSLTNGSNISYVLGRSAAIDQQGEITFTYSTTTGNSLLSLGHFGNTNMLNVFSSGIVSITSSTASTSTTSGALVVTGGVGIGGAVNIGSGIVVTGNNSYYQSSTSQKAQFVGNWGTTSYWGIGPHTTNSQQVRIGISSDVIGTWSGSYPSLFSGAYTNASDYRIKNTITPIYSSLYKILNLKPVTYYLNQDIEKKNLEIGFIAHEVQEQFPELVTGSKDKIDENGNEEHQGIKYAQMTAILVKGMQEQQTLITELKTENEYLKKQINIILSKLEKLE